MDNRKLQELLYNPKIRDYSCVVGFNNKTRPVFAKMYYHTLHSSAPIYLTQSDYKLMLDNMPDVHRERAYYSFKYFERDVYPYQY
jgi:hypothetical protein